MASMVRDYWPGARGAFALRVKLLATESGLDLFSTPQGQVWAVHGEETLGFLEWEQWRDIYEPSGHEVRPGDIVLDCGANVGTFTKKALSRGAALVVAIEPAPQTLNALRRNLEADAQAGRVIVYPKGVWDRDAELEMTVNQVNQGANSLILGPRGPVWSKVRVPLTTIDSIVAELRLPHVDFIKMDIEGAEKQALTGARETIRRFHPRMSISSEHLRDDPTAIPALVNSIEPGYRYQGCDCVPEGWGLRPEVLAFDPGV
jgi:FkbM family methyltransferase